MTIADNDTMTLKDALKEPNMEEFLKILNSQLLLPFVTPAPILDSSGIINFIWFASNDLQFDAVITNTNNY